MRLLRRCSSFITRAAEVVVKQTTLTLFSPMLHMCNITFLYFFQTEILEKIVQVLHLSILRRPNVAYLQHRYLRADNKYYSKFLHYRTLPQSNLYYFVSNASKTYLVLVALIFLTIFASVDRETNNFR